MSEIYSTGPIQDFEALIQNKITKEKEGRKEVSNGHYAAIVLSMFVIVGCLALQNALYGYTQGSTYAAMALLAVMYFAGDWALAALTSLEKRQTNLTLLLFTAKGGLVLLSFTAGVSFMLSEQQHKDVTNSRVASLEADITANQRAFEEYHKTITAQRLTALRRELEQERARVGANHHSSTALYLYLSRFTGVSFEAVSFSVRAVWIFVFIVTGMCLSSLLGLLWCPYLEQRAHRRIIRAEKAAIKRAKEYRTLQQQAGALQTTRALRGSRAPTQDTRTAGRASHRYTDLRDKVQRGAVKPSVASLRKLGMGTATAQKYLRQLQVEGVIIRSGQGFTRTEQ